MVLLNRRRHCPGNADAVRAALHQLRLSGLVGEGRAHRCRVFRAQVEDVADFDPALPRYSRLVRVSGADISGKQPCEDPDIPDAENPVRAATWTRCRIGGVRPDDAVTDQCSTSRSAITRTAELQARPGRRTRPARPVTRSTSRGVGQAPPSLPAAFASLASFQFPVPTHQRYDRQSCPSAAVNDQCLDQLMCSVLPRSAETSSMLLGPRRRDALDRCNHGRWRRLHAGAGIASQRSAFAAYPEACRSGGLYLRLLRRSP